MAPPVPASSAAPLAAAPVIRTVAAKERRPRRNGMILGALVVLVGGLVGLGGARLLSGHSSVLAVARPVQVGSTITARDLTTADVPSDPNLSPIPASERSRVVGLVAQVALAPGELLTRSQVGTGSGFAAGQILVALPLKAGQFPGRGLIPGQKVLVVTTPGTTSVGTSNTATSGGNSARSSAPSDNGIDATVVDVGAMNASTQQSVIDVQVNAGEGVTLARQASTGNVALLLLPAGS